MRADVNEFVSKMFANMSTVGCSGNNRGNSSYLKSRKSSSSFSPSFL